MFDVVYLDGWRRSTVIAAGVNSKTAATIARDEARTRRAARMFRTGSESPPQGHLVMIVQSASGSIGGTRSV